jgi:hypothetical protein
MTAAPALDPEAGDSRSHCSDAVTQEACGSIAAQHLLRSIADEGRSSEHAWLEFIQLASQHGWRSAACRAFVVELAKRAGAA